MCVYLTWVAVLLLFFTLLLMKQLYDAGTDKNA